MQNVQALTELDAQIELHRVPLALAQALSQPNTHSSRTVCRGANWLGMRPARQQRSAASGQLYRNTPPSNPVAAYVGPIARNAGSKRARWLALADELEAAEPPTVLRTCSTGWRDNSSAQPHVTTCREDRCQAIHETQRQTATALTINNPAENATVDRTKVNRVTVISDAARVRCPFAIRARGVHANCTSGSESAARPSPIAGRATPPPYRA